jgi:diaminohydroxyphosphoribosylaminopyrimidine deaminase/5-amino-6-(5-phosphoribosylamino)uracil reductase
VDDPVAVDAMERIRLASAPEEAARIGRTLQRESPELVRSDWTEVKLDVMRAAIRAKLETHAAARDLLRSTGDAEVLEDSPHDAIWGVGRYGDGTNLLGEMFMEVREQL